jgi:Mor family transcriptional regulator
MTQAAEPIEAAMARSTIPPIVKELASFAADELTRTGLDLNERETRIAGARIAARLCRELGGQRFYWPKSDAIDRALRNQTIAAEHDGTIDGPNGIKALARRYRMTEAGLYQILGAERSRRRSAAQ